MKAMEYRYGIICPGCKSLLFCPYVGDIVSCECAGTHLKCLESGQYEVVSDYAEELYSETGTIKMKYSRSVYV